MRSRMHGAIYAMQTSYSVAQGYATSKVVLWQQLFKDTFQLLHIEYSRHSKEEEDVDISSRLKKDIASRWSETDR